MGLGQLGNLVLDAVVGFFWNGRLAYPIVLMIFGGGMGGSSMSSTSSLIWTWSWDNKYWKSISPQFEANFLSINDCVLFVGNRFVGQICGMTGYNQPEVLERR